MKLRTSLILILLCAAGCSNSLPPIADSQQAKEALQAALDAWKKGDTSESLQARVPAIHVNDPDWRNNRKLVQFEIGEDRINGNSCRCEVLLTIGDNSGNPTKEHVSYTIDTDPALVVVRD